jgi:twinkle protein
LLDDIKNSSENKSARNQKGNATKSDLEKNDPLRYLTEVRGLNTKTLRKYGVGRAAYRFPSDKQGGGYQEAECITFPWIMRESDVKSQEAMRGATFELNSGNKDSSSSKTTELTTQASSDEKSDSNTDDNKNEKESNDNDVPTGPFVTRRIKARALERKSWQRLDPPGGGWGLFGLHTVPNDCKTLILTEGEYDAMAVHQATGLPAVSLPNGCRSLPLQVLPLLERFEKIVLWMDSDEPGREGAEKFAKKLGVNRSYIVQCLEAKDANDALLKGNIDMKACIEEATLLPHDRIITFGDLRKDVMKELLEPELYAGTAIPSLPRFTQLIKGFRRGEMTVLTGPTGCGKVRA